MPYLAKMAGAVGNYNAHMAAYPDVNWQTVAQEFVSSLGQSASYHYWVLSRVLGQPNPPPMPHAFTLAQYLPPPSQKLGRERY